MKFLSRSRERAPRGFTLIEVLIAAAIGMVVVGTALQMYLSANKVKSQAAAMNLMKLSGQAAVDEIYRGLHQNAHIFERETLPLPSTVGVTNSWLSRLPMAPFLTGAGSVEPGIVSTDFVLPESRANGEFSALTASAAVNPNFSQSSVGNALFFASQEAKAVIVEPAGGADVLRRAFGITDRRYLIPAYRLHLYFLARRSLGNSREVRAGSNYTYQLMHWQSRMYLDYWEVQRLIRGVKNPRVTYAAAADPDDFLDNHLIPLGTIAKVSNRYYGAIDLGSNNGSLTGQALYDLTLNNTRSDLVVNNTARWLTDDYRNALKHVMHGAFGEVMVAFNTSNASGTPAIPGVPLVGGVLVPAYADSSSRKPFGFEVMVSGPVDVKQVLVRLTLATRLNPSNRTVPMEFQQIVQAYEYFGDASGQIGDAPAPANTSGDWL